MKAPEDHPIMEERVLSSFSTSFLPPAHGSSTVNDGDG